MGKIAEKLKKAVSPYVESGLLWIFGSSIAVQLSGFVSSVVVIRNLPKADYGVYVDAYNIFSYIEVFVGLGLANAVLQFCSENISDGRKNAIFRYSAIDGLKYNVIFVLLLVLLGLVHKPDTTGMFLVMMCAYPIVIYGSTYSKIVLRVRRENKAYAIVNIAYAVVVFVGNVLFTRLWGVMGLVISAYFAYVASVAVASLYFKKDGFFEALGDKSVSLAKHDKKEILNFSVLSASTNFVSMALILLDITCLSFVLGDAEVLADYKVAMAIPAAMLFISDSLTVYFYPSLVAVYGQSREAFSDKIKNCLKLYGIISLALALMMYVLAPLMIRIIYGAKYMSVVPVFRVLTLNFFVNSAVRNFLGNVISAIKKVKVNLAFAGIAGLLNIVLDVIFIKAMGSIGAAIATLIVTLFVTVLECIYVYPYIRRKKS